MTTRYNKKIASIALGLMTFSFAVPFSVFAEGTTVKTNENNFCTKLPQIATKLTSGITDRDSKLQGKRVERSAQIINKRHGIDEKRTLNRVDRDGDRDTRYTELEARATTDIQKAALATFKTNISAAVAKRRTAVDTAVTTFRTGVDSIIANRKTLVDGFIATFTTSANAALAQAQADCANGVAPKTARATFEASMKTAREKLSTSRKALDKNTTEIQTLSTARKNAVNAAIATFKTEVESARTALKAAF